MRDLPKPEVVAVNGISNREFLDRYARAGRVGLSTGTTFADQVIRRAQRHLDADKQWANWSHVFFCEGERADGWAWIMESDLQFHQKHIQLGVQENRLDKYYDEQTYTSLAILDFGLSESQVRMLVREGLELVATRTRYSLRELVGTLIALKQSELRGRQNLLAREHSLFCSAFVRHLFRKIGLDLAPGVDDKHTTPEEIARTPVPHVSYRLQRALPPGKLGELQARITQKVKAKLRPRR